VRDDDELGLLLHPAAGISTNRPMLASVQRCINLVKEAERLGLYLNMPT